MVAVKALCCKMDRKVKIDLKKKADSSRKQVKKYIQLCGFYLERTPES